MHCVISCVNLETIRLFIGLATQLPWTPKWRLPDERCIETERGSPLWPWRYFTFTLQLGALRGSRHTVAILHRQPPFLNESVAASLHCRKFDCSPYV